MLKYFSEKILHNIIYWLTVLTAFTPGIYYTGLIFPYVTTKIIIFRIIVAIMLFCYVVLILKDKKYLPSKNSILLSFLLFVIICFISGQFSLDPSQSFWSTAERMMGTFNLINFLIFLIIISSVLSTKELWHKLLNYWNLIIFSMGSLSFLIYIVNHIIQNQNILTNRFAGFTGNPLYFAAIIIIFFYINLYLFFTKLQTNYKNWELWFHIFISIMYIVCLIFTVSRGAFLSIGVTGLFLLISLIINPNHSLNHWLKIDTQKIGIIILLIACSIVFCMFAFKNTSLLRNNHLVNRLTTFNLSDGSSLSRIFVTKIGINCFLQRPLLGYGFDNFEICFQKNFEPIITNVVPEQSRFDKAHNMPIEIMATTGIFGIIFFLGIYFFAYKNIRDLMLSDNIDFYAGLSLILGIVAYFIQNLFMFDIFEGFISLIVLLGFIIVLKNENKININIPKNWSNLIIILVAVFMAINIYQFNILTWYYDSFHLKIKKLVTSGKVNTALNVLRNTKIKNPHQDALYFGFFNTFTVNQKNFTNQQLLDYYNIIHNAQITLSKRYPYRTRLYLYQLAHIASKGANKNLGITSADVKRTLEIIDITKSIGMRLSELDFFEIQVLLNSRDPKDWVLGKQLASEFVKLYSESGKFHWIYGVYLIDKEKNIKEGIKELKLSQEKNLIFESIDQLMIAVTLLNKHNESVSAVDIINKYLPSNLDRYQLYIELAKAHINLKNYSLARQALYQAKKVYESQRATNYNSLAESVLKDLENQLNNLTK